MNKQGDFSSLSPAATAPPSVSADDPPPPYPGLSNVPMYPAAGAQPPPMGFQIPPPQQQQAYHTAQPASVIYQQPRATVIMVTPPPPLGKHPTTVHCAGCQEPVQSRVRSEISGVAHLSALVLCLVGCWICCPLPYLLESCRNINHYCPNCKNYLGTNRANAWGGQRAQQAVVISS